VGAHDEVMEPLTRQLRWLIAIRLLVITSIVLPYFLLDTFLPDVSAPIGLILPADRGEEAAQTSPPGTAGGEAARAEAGEAAVETPADRAPADRAPAGEAASGAPVGAGPVGAEPVGAQPVGAAPVGAEPVGAQPVGGTPATRVDGDEASPGTGSPLLDRSPRAVLVTERRPVGLSPGMVYELAGFTYLASFFYLLLLHLFPRRPERHAYVQFSGDLLLITTLVYFTGGITSPFSLFYLVVIAVASTLLRRQAGFSVATAAYLLYAGTLLAIYYGRLPTPEAQTPAEDPIYRLTYNLTVNFVGFYAVAVLTSTLAHRVTRAERELEAKREDLADLQVVHRDVIQSITSGLATTDAAGRITSLNRAGEEILGVGEKDLVGRQVQDLLGPERWRQLTGESPSPEPSQRGRSEAELERGSETVFVGFSISPLTDATGAYRGWNVVFQDLTRWRKLEEEVRFKDRMAAVGELASGIAHEIGNPLAAISGSVQMLASSFAGDAPQQKLLDILLKESQRLDRTIKGFLRFARPRERSLLEFDVAALLSEHLELLRNSDELHDHHRLQLDLDPPSVLLLADPDQMSQIFWNLARNALKAMPDGGTLAIHGRQRGDLFRLSFQDTGRGMSERQRSNLFHPFQSFFDSGTGIGMAIVYRIVEDHGGRLEVESAEGQGTTIRIALPVARPGAAAAADAEPAAEVTAAAQAKGSGVQR